MNFFTKSDYIYDLLKRRITEGEYAQGETITISDVAAENNMSAIPVREALKRLESEGLVNIVPHKGASVTSYDEKKIVEVMSIRALLEGFAARKAAEKIGEEELRELYQLNEEMRDLAENHQDERYIEINRLFHKKLYNVSDMPSLNEMINNVWQGGNWSKALFAYFPNEMTRSVDEHQIILDAIGAKDFEKVEKLMRKHKEGSIQQYLKLANKTKKE